MDNQLKRLISELESAINSPEFIEISENVIQEISMLDHPSEAVAPILFLMEKNPNADYGTPGPLVHFLESFNEQEYDEELVKSIERCPTQHTTWMLNRIINSSEGKKKKYYLRKLDEILAHPNIEKDLAELINRFKNFQIKR